MVSTSRLHVFTGIVRPMNIAKRWTEEKQILSMVNRRAIANALRFAAWSCTE